MIGKLRPNVCVVDGREVIEGKWFGISCGELQAGVTDALARRTLAAFK